MSAADKIEVENVNCPGLVSRVDAKKYKAMRKVLLKVLPKKMPGLTQKEVAEAIKPHFPEDLWPGGSQSMWWDKSVQLDLQAKGLVLRSDTKTLQLYRG